MERHLTLVFAVAAGFLGGLLSQSVGTGPVHAQSQPQAQKEIRAQNFLLVNDRGQALGLFGVDPNGHAVIKLLDEQGRTVWSTQARPQPLHRSGE